MFASPSPARIGASPFNFRRWVEIQYVNGSAFPGVLLCGDSGLRSELALGAFRSRQAGEARAVIREDEKNKISVSKRWQDLG
jgi:hypothetical protein